MGNTKGFPLISFIFSIKKLFFESELKIIYRSKDKIKYFNLNNNLL